MIWAILLSILLLLVIVYLASVFLVVRFSLKPPRIHQFISPGILGFPQENVTFTTEDGVSISAWWMENQGDLVLIACHGYLINRCEWVPTLSFLADGQSSFLFLDHRGQGRSGEARVTFGKDEMMDVEAAISFVKARKPSARIVLLGSSMGAVASANAAARSPELVSGLILDAPYRSLDEALAGWWLFLGGKLLARLMYPAQFVAKVVLGFNPAHVRSDDPLTSYPGPKLIFYGGDDPLIPEASAKAVEETLVNGRCIYFPGETHGSGRLNQPELFRISVMDFLTRNGLAESGKLSQTKG